MRFHEFILEDFKTAKVAFANQGVDPAEIDELFTTYRTLTKKNQFQGNEKNIDWWAKQGWEAFKTRVSSQAAAPTKTTLKRNKVQGKAIELESPNPEWEIYVPLDKEASCNIGSGSDWCTTKREQNYFESYFYDRGVTLIYFVGAKTKFAIAMHKDLKQMEFFTKQDKSIKQTEFEHATGIKVDGIRSQVMQYMEQITTEQKSANIKDPKRALKYAKETGKRFPEGEKAIASDAEVAVDYATTFAMDRFPEAEPVILRKPLESYHYAKNVLKQRWPAAEPMIAQHAYEALLYARNVIKGRFPEAEEVIAKSAGGEGLKYAVWVTKGRFPAYEPIALQRANTAWEYIKNVIKGPWPEAEPILKTSGQYSSYYTQLTGRKL